ncbi:MAG: class II aldolase/adducin family protein, partial [Pseudomonadota bacterium]
MMQNQREQLLNTCQKLAELGLNKGTSGNVSVRLDKDCVDGFLVTPSGIPVEEMTADSMVNMQFDGNFEQGKKPS